jgi:hypothetical protein
LLLTTKDRQPRMEPVRVEFPGEFHEHCRAEAPPAPVGWFPALLFARSRGGGKGSAYTAIFRKPLARQ